MDARRERKLRLFAGLVAAGVLAGIAFVIAKGDASASSIAVGIVYGRLITVIMGSLRCSCWKVRCGFGSGAFRSHPT
jgi:hypothetical protein